MMRHFLAAFVIALSACAAPVQHQTASGRPERQFSATPDTVRPVLINELVNRKYNITQESQSLIVAEKLSDNAAANLLLGTGHSPQLTVRVRFMMMATTSGTRVVGDIDLVQNRGTAFEKVIPQTHGASSVDMQTALDGLRV